MEEALEMSRRADEMSLLDKAREPCRAWVL